MRLATSEVELASQFRSLLGQCRIVKSALSPRAFAEEVSCVSGRPDFLVGPHMFDDWSAERRDVVAAALSVPSDARLVSLLRPRAPRTREYLRAASGLGEYTFRAALNRLLKNDIVRVVGRDAFVLASDIPSAQFELWAFEVKLNNIRRVSYQAVRNRLFAHRSFIVMPIKVVCDRQLEFDALGRLGVGVIAIDTSRQITIDVVRGRKSKPKSRFQQLAALGRFIRHKRQAIPTAELC